MMTAREYGAIIQERVEGDSAPSTTEKMLSANAELSNIFLQRGQNIDIADKNRADVANNFGS